MTVHVNDIPDKIKATKEEAWDRACEKLDDILTGEINLIRHMRGQWIEVTKQELMDNFDGTFFESGNTLDGIIKEYRSNGWEVEQTENIFQGEMDPPGKGIRIRKPPFFEKVPK